MLSRRNIIFFKIYFTLSRSLCIASLALSGTFLLSSSFTCLSSACREMSLFNHMSQLIGSRRKTLVSLILLCARWERDYFDSKVKVTLNQMRADVLYD